MINTVKKIRSSKMLIPTIIMGMVAFILLFIGCQKGQGQHISGIKLSLNMLIGILPLLFFAFVVAGMVQILLPRDLLLKWIGTESGLRGILIGTLAGALTPGGPYTSMPIVAGLMRAGASIGTLVAFITGWSLWALARLPLEVGILGWRFALIRITCTFFFPPLAGLIAQTLFGNIKLI